MAAFLCKQVLGLAGLMAAGAETGTGASLTPCRLACQGLQWTIGKTNEVPCGALSKLQGVFSSAVFPVQLSDIMSGVQWRRFLGWQLHKSICLNSSISCWS